MSQPLNVLALFAHPDDAEFLCAGTLVHLAGRGAQIHLASMTAGDCGSMDLPGPAIAEIRIREAQNSGRLIRAPYSCMEQKDLQVFYDRRTLSKVMELVRLANPQIVFTHSPQDYMVDHEVTSRLAQTACFGATAPNFRIGTWGSARPLRRIPHLYYAQPFGGRDILGALVPSRVYVDIAATFERKGKMLACHESQMAFLKAQEGMSDPQGLLREMAASAGQRAGFGLAEGFRQHLGQGFPQDNLLATVLGDLVRSVDT
jgi:N-acetylglucosamine malate deacetylase 1